MNLLAALKNRWWHRFPRMFGDGTETRAQRVIRRVRVGIVLGACLVTFQSVLLVIGAWENDRRIDRNKAVAAAEVLDAGPRRSTIEFVTPDRVTYRPELGVLYPSELDTGMRIYVEYDRTEPDLVRVQDRNAALAIIPAGSIAVLGWLVAGVALSVVAVIARRLDDPVAEQAGQDQAGQGQAGQGQAEATNLSSQSLS